MIQEFRGILNLSYSKLLRKVIHGGLGLHVGYHAGKILESMKKNLAVFLTFFKLNGPKTEL